MKTTEYNDTSSSALVKLDKVKVLLQQGDSRLFVSFETQHGHRMFMSGESYNRQIHKQDSKL
jgi:hypothetical protein